MDKKIFDMLELNKSPMLAVENCKIAAANTPARRLLGDDVVGMSPVGLLPEHLFSYLAEKYTCSALIKDQSFSADVHRSGNTVYISLSLLTPPEAPTDYISDFLMNSLLNDLFTLGISINCTLQELGRSPEEKILHNLQIMNHNYFSLRRSLQNLHSALQLRKNNLYVNKRGEDLCLICSELASTLEHTYKQTGIELSFSTPVGTLPCSLDRDLIERVILNILCNSYMATPSGGSVKMRLEKQGANAVITIEDNGNGISAATMANIFTRYELPLTLENLRQPSTGGLGLSISRGIVEKHGGALMIESREGSGTRVSIILPAQPGMLRLESESIIPRMGGMDRVLTEFSPVLDSSFYSREYMD